MYKKFIFNRKGKLNKKGKALVQLFVFFGRDTRKYFSTGNYIEPHQWDDKNQKVVSHPEKVKYNVILKNMWKKWEDAEMKLIRKDQEVTWDRMRRIMKLGGEEGEVVRFIREQIKASDLGETTKVHLKDKELQIRFCAPFFIVHKKWHIQMPNKS